MTNTELANQVKAMLNDKKAVNRLIGYEDEYSQEDVNNSCNMALTEINGKTIYKTNFNMDTCDPYILVLGTAKYLLLAVISAKTRNYITVNDGGTSVNREGNIDLYYRIYDSIKAEFDEQLETYKFNLNLNAGYGH